MTRVFFRMHYSVLDILPFFIERFGNVQIQQTIEQSYNNVFDVWFYTDEVEMKEGELRQVEVIATESKEGSLGSSLVYKFEVNKI